jgi:hypothetical protein
MLTESEILDEQVQTLDEALDKLTDHESNQITANVVPDTDVSQAVSVTVECLKATVDLYHTISAEGVSAADVKALRHIRERMSPYMTLSYRPALEAYEGMFTPNRSMINQVVSQEATLAEIGITLKEWFFKFIDFVIKVVDWCRIAWNSETAVNMRLRRIDHNLQSMFNAFDDVYKRNKLAGRELSKELNEIAKQVLLDPKLTRTRAMLQAFGVKQYEGVINDADSVVDDAYRWILMDIVGLKNHIEQNKPMALGHDYAADINVAVDTVEALHVADADVDFFIENLPKDFWASPKQLLARKVYPPSHNIEQVQQIAKKFREIRRNANFEKLDGVDEIVQAVENITGTIKGLERMITAKQNLFTNYYKASATLANFYIRGRDMLMEEYLKNVDDDSKKIVMDKLQKQWDDICYKMGL